MKSIRAQLMAVLLFVLLAAVSVPAVADQSPPEKSAHDLLTAAPLKDDAQDDELRKLLKARYNEALEEVQVTNRLFQAARVSFDSFAESEQRLILAGLELCDTPADKVTLLKQYVELMKNTELLARARIEAARGTEAELHRARYQRLDGEIQLLRAKREADKAK